jgi:hypothetical protein
MTTETTSRGGFVGDPAEAFNPPAAGGCCGGTSAGTATATCCGTVQAADEAGTSCDPGAKADAVAEGTGCCG